MKPAIAAFAAVLLVGCLTPTESVTTPGIRLSDYHIAVVGKPSGYHSAAELQRAMMKVFNLLGSKGFAMVGEEEAAGMAEGRKAESLLVHLAISQSSEESVVSITFYDYVTGRPVANCTGAFGFGFSMEHDLRVATDRAIEQVARLLSL